MSSTFLFSVLILLTTSTNGSNLLCNEDDWEIIKGTWDYNSDDCSIASTDYGYGNVIWLGSEDGSTPNSDYSFDSFRLTVEMSCDSSTNGPGVLIRASTVSTTNNGGHNYYVGLDPKNNEVIFGKMNEGSWTQLYSQSYTINTNVMYTLVIEASKQTSSYNVYVDDTAIFTNIVVSDYVDGSIGLRTFNSPATYYSVDLESIEETNELNVLCNEDDWNIIKGTWDYDQDDCTISNPDSGDGNVVWFGSNDGLTPNNDYSFRSFLLTVKMSCDESSSSIVGPGVLIRASTVSTTNNGGEQYYIGLYPDWNEIKIGKMDDGWTELYSKSYTIDANVVYTLVIEAYREDSSSTYNVYLDGTEIFTNIVLSDYLDGSIGLRTYYAPATYYYVELESFDVTTTPAPTIDNLLCNIDDWSEIKGTWDYNSDDCSIASTDYGYGNVIWLGSEDGSTPNNDYSFGLFRLTVEMLCDSSTNGPGVLIRASTVSTTNNGGHNYYVGLDPKNNEVIVGIMNEGSWTQLYSQSCTINTNVVYTLVIEATEEESSYNVYLDGNTIFTDISLTDYTDGSIGLRTFNSPATYYSVVLESFDETTATEGSETDRTCKQTSSCQYTTLSRETVNCFGYLSCSYSTIEIIEDLRCGGLLSCDDATLSMSSNDGKIECDGSISCRNSIISSNVTHCNGKESCSYSTISSSGVLIASGDESLRNAIITNTPYIVDSGEYTLRDAVISSKGMERLEIESSGHYSASNSTVLCYSGSTCTVTCGGEESCDGMKIQCENGATCRTSCHSCARCPSINDVTTIDELSNPLIVNHGEDIEREEKDLLKSNKLKDEYKKLVATNSGSEWKQNMIDIINNTPGVVIVVFGGCILFAAMIQFYTWSKMLFLKWTQNKNVSWISNHYEYQYQSI